MHTSDHPASRAARAAAAGIPVFDGLNHQQLRGWQCVVFRCNLLSIDGEDVPLSVVVGVSRATGDEVRACEAHARDVGWRPDSGWEQPALL